MEGVSAQIDPVIFNTGITPEFAARHLGIGADDLTDSGFVQFAMERRDLWRWPPTEKEWQEQDSAALLEKWERAWIAWDEQWRQESRDHAMIVWKAVRERVNCTGDPEFDESPIDGFNPLIRKYLNESSIQEFIKIAVAEHVRTQAIANAHIRHSENRAMKAEVFAWYRENGAKYRSLDDAAMAAMEVVPVRFRTALDWIGQARRSDRSAGTP